jgi:KDO2-lipid IV(A) lauroyltransferase
MKNRNKIIDYMTYLLFRVAVTIFHMFPLDANLRTARLIGSMMWLMINNNIPVVSKIFRRKHREQIMENLHTAFGNQYSEQELEKIAKASCQSLVMFAMEFLFTSRVISIYNWHQFFTLKNFEPALKILLENRGAIMLTGHYSNFELPGYFMATLGFDMVAVMRPLDNPYLNDYIVKAREKHGLSLLYKKGASASMEQTLHDGSILSFIADQDAGHKGVFVDFFGKKASTYRSISLVAREMKVPIIVGGSRRTSWEKFQHEIELEDIIYPEDWQGKEDEVKYITERFNRALENMIRKDPTQYLWLHRRWKSRPPEERKQQ